MARGEGAGGGMSVRMSVWNAKTDSREATCTSMYCSISDLGVIYLEGG